MKLPSYPIATIDPHFSIWSKSDNLTEGDTYLWCGFKKRIEGNLTLDGKAYRFLGAGNGEAMAQTDTRITPFVSEYDFENEEVRLTFRTWSPFLFEDLHILSLPASYLECDVVSLDGKKHNIQVSFTAYDELCLGRSKKTITKYTDNVGGLHLVKMGLTKQVPLNDSGDNFAADWGYVYLAGKENSVCKEGIRSGAVANGNKEASFSTLIFYDDVYSINYFGQMLKGLWAEKFANAETAVAFCLKERDSLFAKIKEQDNRFLKDSEKYGEDYQKIISAAARQVLAGHKLVRNNEGELLYLSKECHSNGCINTVDVSYPAAPLYLIYCPELIKAMLVGICHFAKSDLWTAKFAPHDIGRYPIACGQVYALKPHEHLIPHKISYKKVYKKKKLSIYMPEFQMPVEECGNMLILSYTYYLFTKDREFLLDNIALLKKWASYLRDAGVVLNKELCTDDFAGHSVKNVNLAIKGIMGIACFAKICDELDITNDCMDTAKSFADKLVSECNTDKPYLPFSIGKNDSWSLKYNLVWDKLLGFNLFDEKLYEGESEKYRQELNEYGVPLDYRKDFTKTDWMLWSACLDKTEENIAAFSKCLVKYLADTKQKNCFSDWIETKQPTQHSFDHRTVQGGLWIPVLMDRLL